MNLLQVQDRLKNLPMQAVMSYANGQNPEVPPYLALAELNRRKAMQQQQAQMPQGTVKDKLEQEMGVGSLAKNVMGQMATEAGRMQSMQGQMPPPHQQAQMPAPDMPPPPQQQEPIPMPGMPGMARGGIIRLPTRDAFKFAPGGIVPGYNGATGSWVDRESGHNRDYVRSSINYLRGKNTDEEKSRAEREGERILRLMQDPPDYGSDQPPPDEPDFPNAVPVEQANVLSPELIARMKEQSAGGPAPRWSADSTPMGGMKYATVEEAGRAAAGPSPAGPATVGPAPLPANSPVLAGDPSGFQNLLLEAFKAAQKGTPVKQRDYEKELAAAAEKDPYLKMRPTDIMQPMIDKAQANVAESEGRYKTSEQARARAGLWNALMQGAESTRGLKGHGLGSLGTGLGKALSQQQLEAVDRDQKQADLMQDRQMAVMKMQAETKNAEVAMSKGKFDEAFKHKTEADKAEMEMRKADYQLMSYMASAMAQAYGHSQKAVPEIKQIAEDLRREKPSMTALEALDEAARVLAKSRGSDARDAATLSRELTAVGVEVGKRKEKQEEEIRNLMLKPGTDEERKAAETALRAKHAAELREMYTRRSLPVPDDLLGKAAPSGLPALPVRVKPGT